MSELPSNVLPIHSGPQENVLPQPHELADPNIANALGLLALDFVAGFACVGADQNITALTKKLTFREDRKLVKYGTFISMETLEYLISRGWLCPGALVASVTGAG